MTDPWLDFIASCRAGKRHGHDVAISTMANDQAWSHVADYMDGAITREQLWALARLGYPTHQIASCAGSALRCLTFVAAREA